MKIQSITKQLKKFENQIKLMNNINFTAKFGGATGNFNAHHVAFPEHNWVKFANKFIENLGMKRQYTTTQIEHYDNLAALMDNIKRINNILIEICFNLNCITFIKLILDYQNIFDNF